MNVPSFKRALFIAAVVATGLLLVSCQSTQNAAMDEDTSLLEVQDSNTPTSNFTKENKAEEKIELEAELQQLDDYILDTTGFEDGALSEDEFGL
jgi:ABC-type metal ion transport system substrate-binding protein